MRGIISINFINNSVCNKYPVIMYYNGNESKILDSITKELSSYIFDNFITAELYTNTSLYVVTYFTDDDNIDSKETTSKYVWKIEDICPLSEDVCKCIINNILSNIGDVDNILQHNISETTIINYIRYKLQLNNFKKEDINTIISTKNIVFTT